jgi:hypothetical protein
MVIKALDGKHHERKMKIAVIEIDENQWGDPRVV